jgi:hypothetical protein
MQQDQAIASICFSFQLLALALRCQGEDLGCVSTVRFGGVDYIN